MNTIRIILFASLISINLICSFGQEMIDTSELVQMINNIQNDEHKDHAHIRIVQSGGGGVRKSINQIEMKA
jgi:hypothetical protein